MTIRNKLLILLLGVSLIPLVAYFALDVSFSRVARNRIQNSLRSALEANAGERLVDAVDNYEKTLKMSAEAVRYGLRHYANQVQQSLWAIEVEKTQPARQRYLVPASADLSVQVEKYRSLTTPQGQIETVDFDSHLVHPAEDGSDSALRFDLPQLASTCRDIYSINPESKLWVYTVLENGTATLYPSPGIWPYERGHDLRQEAWYTEARTNRRLTPTLRIEPLTGKSVMTAGVPLFDQDGSFAGAIAMDIDLSAMLERMRIPQQWQQGALKLLIRLPADKNKQVEEAGVVCCTTFLESQHEPGTHSRLVDICGQDAVAEMVEKSRRGEPGIIRQPYDGLDSLWIYGSSADGGGFPILVVPYQRIVEQADYAQQVLFKDNVLAIQVATVLIFLAIVAAVILAVMRARKVTVPITHLADAAGKLARGDFGVRVRIATNDELQQLGDVFNQVGPRLYERQKIKESLGLAREIQQHFLPTEDLQLDNFEVAGLCRYCDETGGDYYDMFDLRAALPGRVGLVIGDVSGHGLPAAMLMISAGSILRNNAPRHGENLSAAVAELNSHLERNSEPGKFMTLFYGLLDDKGKTLSWTSAGHDPAIWYKAKSGELTELPNTGMPLGIMSDAEFGNSGPVTLEVGDIVVVGTDGIWEAADTSEQMYGKERLIDLIEQKKGESANKLAAAVVESVVHFCSGAPQTDDVTLLVIKCIG
jgi:sigma-B regulation protein RsbU (phosphoserine phosphatase)